MKSNLSLMLASEMNQNILTNLKTYKKLNYHFYILDEKTLGIKFARNLYRVQIIEKDSNNYYWMLSLPNEPPFLRKIGSEKNFYDILFEITEYERRLIIKKNPFY